VAPKKPGKELAGVVKSLDTIQKIVKAGKNPKGKG